MVIKGSGEYFIKEKIRLKNLSDETGIKPAQILSEEQAYLILKEAPEEVKSKFSNFLKNMKKNCNTKDVVFPRLDVGFYTYEFDNNELRFKVTHVDTVDVSFIQTNKWYKLYICINGEFTGRYLNLQSMIDLEYYSSRKEIGIAYRNYRDGLIYTIPDGSVVSETIKVPTDGIANEINYIIKNNLSKINKFASRDELTNLKLI